MSTVRTYVSGLSDRALREIQELADEVDRHCRENLGKVVGFDPPSPPPPQRTAAAVESGRRARAEYERARAGKSPPRVTPQSTPRQFRLHNDPIGAELDRIVEQNKRLRAKQ